MKIAIYQIEKIYPQNELDSETLLDIVTMPSLKYGYISVLGSHRVENITKRNFNNTTLLLQRYYNPSMNCFINGYYNPIKHEFIIIL